MSGIFDLDGRTNGAFEAGRHDLGLFDNTDLMGVVTDNKFMWQKRKQPGGGAMEYAFLTYALPLEQYYGRGVQIGGTMELVGRLSVANPLVTSQEHGTGTQSVSTDPLYDPNSRLTGGVKV